LIGLIRLRGLEGRQIFDRRNMKADEGETLEEMHLPLKSF